MEAPHHLVLRLASKLVIHGRDTLRGGSQAGHRQREAAPSIFAFFSGSCKAAQQRKRALDMYLGSRPPTGFKRSMGVER